MLFGFCKRGHPRTKETTFERKVKIKGKLYIVRECRICHAMRNNKTPSWSKGQSRSKWAELRGDQ
jgi:hypothetical protein